MRTYEKRGAQEAASCGGGSGGGEQEELSGRRGARGRASAMACAPGLVILVRLKVEPAYITSSIA